MSVREAPGKSTEELLERAAGNYVELVYGTLEFLQRKGISITEYAAWIGARHAETWSPGGTAMELAGEMAANMLSVGAKTADVTGDEMRARVVLAGWPPAGSERYPVDPADVDRFLDLIHPIAERQGCAFERDRDGDRLVMTFVRGS